MKKTRKLLLLLAVVCTLLVCCMVSASAETEGYYTYTVTDGEATITAVDTAIAGEVVIPDTLGGAPVTTISERAFENCVGMTAVTIPASITTFQDSAFLSCENIDAVYITDIDKWWNYYFGIQTGTSPLYYGADMYVKGELLTKLVVPEDRNWVNSNFKGCTSITEVILHDGISSIGHYAFEDCANLKIISIPESVTNIGSLAFSDCGIENITLPHSVTEVSYGLFLGCKDLTIVNMLGDVATIGIDAFSGCSNLTGISIPDSVTSIGAYAFNGCYNIESITVPEGVEVIAMGLFNGCRNLTEINLPDDLTSIENFAFGGCSNLVEIDIPEKVKNIGDCAFGSCTSLISLAIPDSVETIGIIPFVSCTSLKTVSFGNGTTTIVNSMFYNLKSLTSVSIPNSVTAIEDSAFYGCTGLTSIKIPESVTTIGREVFYDCTSLDNIIIPNSVTTIGEQAFYGCTGLKSATIGSSEVSIATFALLSRTASASQGIVIGKEAFKNCINLKTLLLSDKVTKIEASVFEGCTSLEKIHFEGSKEDWTNIGGSADLGCGEDVIVCIYNGPIEEHTHDYSKIENGANWDNRCTREWEENHCCECGDYKVVEKSAIGHSETTDKAVAATCTKTGLTEGLHCSRCNAVLVAQQTVDAKGHRYTNYVSNNNATCTADGTKTATCNNGCGTKDTITDSGSKLSHSDNNHDGKCDRACGYDFTAGCSCRCHKNDFIWKFLNFFYKLFKMNHYCACGKAHY